MSFQPTEAAFEGFRIVRRTPMTVVWWGVAYVAFFLVFFAVAGRGLLDIMAQAQVLEGGGEPTWDEVRPLLIGYGNLVAMGLPLAMVSGAVLSAAVARSVIEPGRSAFGYMRLGMDELRVLGVSLILGFILGLVWMATCTIPIALIATAQAANLPWLWLLFPIVVLAGLALTIWLAVRLSLAIPIVIAERRFAVFDSFRMTRGRFWPLLGMVILTVVMSLLVSLLGGIIAMPIELVTGPVTAQMAEIEDVADILARIQAIWPWALAWLILNCVLSALQLAVMYAPFSRAYLQIKGASGEVA